MHLSKIAAAAVLATTATAAPTPQDEPKPNFGVAFTFENGTFTDIFPVPDSISEIELNSGGVVSFVFVQPAVTGQFGSCAFLRPNRQSLGTVQVNKATMVPVTPPAPIGFVQCNTV